MDMLDALAFPVYNWFGNMVIYPSATLIAWIITLNHSRHVYLDLTSNKTGNSIDNYRLLTSSTLLSLISYASATSFMTLYLFIAKEPKDCQMNVITVGLAYLVAKISMYLSFIIRLSMVYNNSFYEYNSTILRIICVCIIIYGLGCCAGMVLFATPYHPYQHPTKQYISFCQTGGNLWLGALIVLYDMSCCIGSMIAFINPLRKLIKTILMRNTSQEQCRNLTPLIKIGNKYAILTSVAAISTFMTIMVAALGSHFIAPLDFIANMICMILMTNYYNEGRYYERLCCGIIKCSKPCSSCCCGYNDGMLSLRDEMSGGNGVKLTVLVEGKTMSDIGTARNAHSVSTQLSPGTSSTGNGVDRESIGNSVV